MDQSRKKRVAVLISGRGSNLAALIEATSASDYPAEIVLVVSSNKTAAGLGAADDAGVETAVITVGRGDDRPKSEQALHERLEQAEVDIVCLAGYMHILSGGFVDRWRDRIINIHPSLLPAFKGLETHARALEAGVRMHGATVHVVRAEIDDGPIIAQAAVRVGPNDSAAALAARVLRAEHLLYPHALAIIASGGGRSGAQAKLDDTTGDQNGVLFSPPLV